MQAGCLVFVFFLPIHALLEKEVKVFIHCVLGDDVACVAIVVEARVRPILEKKLCGPATRILK